MATIKQYVIYGDNNQIGLGVARAQNLGGGAMVHKEVRWYINKDVSKDPFIHVKEWKFGPVKVVRVVRYPLTPIRLAWSEVFQFEYWKSLMRHDFRKVRAQIIEIPSRVRVISMTGQINKKPIEESFKESGLHWRIREIEEGTYG